MVTVSNLQRLSATKLADLILQAQDPAESKVAIVDVRDDDHIGGHIKGSIHFPSSQFDAMLPTLLRKLEDKDTVVFHCALSQQRGPGAALRYMRAREQYNDEKPREKVEETGSGALGDATASPAQKVYVLDRGFVGWQEVYGQDERLTEAYVKDLWQDY